MKTIEKQISDIKYKMMLSNSHMFYDVNGERHHVRQDNSDWYKKVCRVLELYKTQQINYITVVEYNSASQKRTVFYNKKGKETGVWMW